MQAIATALVLTITLLCLAPSSYAASTYYISKSAGSDSNTSTQAKSKSTPWAHLPGMASCSSNCAGYTPVAGDTFVMMGCDVWVNADMPIAWQWSGSSGNRIVIGGEDQTWYNTSNCPSSWNRPVLDAQKIALNRSFINPNAGGTDTHDVTFDSIEFTHYEAGNNTDVIQWVGTTSVNITYQNLYIHAWDASADSACVMILGVFTPATSSNIVVQNNVIDGSDRTGTSGTSGVCYTFYTSYWGFKILNNVINDSPNSFVVGASTGSQSLEIGGNLIENGLNSQGGVNHCNMIELQGGTTYIHDNVIKNFYCPGGLTLELGQAASEVDYVWNNVIYGLDVGSGNAAPPETGETFSGIQTYFWNNTVVVPSSATNPCLNQESGRTPTSILVNFQNNHCISNGANAVFNFGTEGTLVANNYLLMSTSAAASDGYASSQPYAFSPASSHSPTVAGGTNLTSSMSSWVSGFSTNDTKYGCSEQTISGVVQAVCPGRTTNSRPSSGAWDIGAYEFQPSSPAGSATNLIMAQSPPIGPGTCTGVTLSTCSSSTRTQAPIFAASILPNISGVVLQVDFAALDNCFSSRPCYPDNDSHCTGNAADCYNFAVIDNAIAIYRTLTVGVSGTFDNGCVNSSQCGVALHVEFMAEGSPTLNTTPQYVFSNAYATALGAPPNDVSFCTQAPGGSNAYYSGTACTPGNGACVANLAPPPTCDVYDGGSCSGSLIAANMSGMPVTYEVPFMTAYQALLTAIAIHYSPSGLGSGPSYAKYIKAPSGYERAGLGIGSEPNASCVMSGASNKWWPGPKGLALEPQGYKHSCYLDGKVTDGPCTDLPSGYVGTMDSFIGGLQSTYSIPQDGGAHAGPPNDANSTYITTEALLASQYCTGIGTQSATLSDITNLAAGNNTSQGWTTVFPLYPGNPSCPVFKHLQFEAVGNVSPNGAAWAITSISVAGTTATLTCTNSGCTNAEGVCGAVVQLTGTSNANLNNYWTFPAAGTNCTGGVIKFTVPSGTASATGGTLFYNTSLLTSLPFFTQHTPGVTRTLSAEVWNCALAYAFGVTSCAGLTGPDSTWQQAITNFYANTPTSTSQVSGKAKITGNAQMR